GVSVSFAVAPGNGTITGASQTTNASGIAAVGSWTLATTAGTDTLTATSADLAGSPVTFTATGTPGGAGSIAVNAGDGQSATVGTAVATDPSVIVRDRFGNPVANVAVTFAVASGNGGVTGANQTTNASGVATVTSWTLGTTVGTNTLRATSQGLNGSPVIFTATSRPAAPSASRSLVSVTPGVITASTGSSVATISVTVRDGFDNPIPGATVMLAATPSAGNMLTQALGTTDASGEITGSLSSTAAGTKTVTATVNGTLVITETATVTVTAGAVSASQSTVAAAPTSIAAGSATSTLTVTARDAHGNPIEGATVVLAATPTTGNTLTQPVGTTNADGVATGTLASTAAGDKTVSATINNSVSVAQRVTVTVTPGGVSASQSTVVAAPTSIAAGSGSSTITVTARDASGNPIQGVTVTLAATPAAGSTLTQAPGTTDASGVATVGSWTLSTTAGPDTLTARAAGSGISGNPVTFTATGTAGAATQIAITGGDGQTATAGTAVQVAPSVIVRDVNGNPVGGVSVTFAVASGGGTVVPTTPVTTESNGIAAVTSWTLGPTAGSNTLTATATGLTGSPATFTATGTAGVASQIAINAGDGQTATAGTAGLVNPSGLAHDANGNPGAAGRVRFAVASGANGITAVTSWTLRPTAGPNTLTATSGTLTGSPLTFTATGTAGAAATLVKSSGDNLTGPVATRLQTPHVVLVSDANGNAV